VHCLHWWWWLTESPQESSKPLIVAHRDGKRFVLRADEKLSAFVELERQVLTVTFYLESIHGDS
jgi:hypothetical protein